MQDKSPPVHPRAETGIGEFTKNGIAFRLEEPPATKLRPKSYAWNFKYGRPDRWTH